MNTETGKTFDFETGFEDWEIGHISLLSLADNMLGIPPATSGGHMVAMAGNDQVRDEHDNKEEVDDEYF